jgi:hypothetical protein
LPRFLERPDRAAAVQVAAVMLAQQILVVVVVDKLEAMRLAAAQAVPA